MRLLLTCLPACCITVSSRLAAQHRLDPRGCRKQLIGLSHREHFARLGFDMADEARQVTTGLGSVVGRKVSLHGLQLTIEAGLDTLGR